MSIHGNMRCAATLDDVEVWLLDLEVRAPPALEELSGAERERMTRLVFERDRRRFAAAHAGLRALVAAHVGCRPRDLVFTAGRHGKPLLQGGPHFSLSYAGDFAACAISPRREVGVDLERMRVVPEADEIAANLFTDEERRAYAIERERYAERAFLRCWTRMEARLKAAGVGLSGPPGSPTNGAFLVRDLDLLPDHAAALAIERRHR